MKVKICILIFMCAGIYVFLHLCGCSIFVRMCTERPVSLDYVGKINLGALVTIGDRTRIPVTFEGGRWNDNSGIVFREFKTVCQEHSIFISVITSVADKGGYHSECEIQLKGLNSGQYVVYYLDPDGKKHEIGSIAVARP